MNKGLILSMGVVLSLVACASPPRRAAEGPRVPPAEAIRAGTDASDVERLILYAERLLWVAPAGLDSERATAEREYRQDPSAFNRVRLAMLLALRRAPFRDDARARELLSAAARETGSDAQPLRSLAMLLLRELDERWANERVIEDERRQRQTLQKKLDQLKAIEEEMNRRSPPAMVSPRQ